MAEANNLILLVEDEVEVAEIVRDYLLAAQYSVELIHTGAGVVEKVKSSEPSCVLLDIMLPEVDGVSICQEIRSFSDVPVIMLTAKVDEIDRLIGYDIGADDYICKPVNPREILARVKTVLRRLGPGQSSGAFASKPSLELDESRMLAFYQGKRLDLTRTEFQLLKLLYKGEGKIFSRKNIKQKIYDSANDPSDRAVDTCIKKLRSKISKLCPGDNPIRSVYGAGYSYEDS